MRRRQLAKVAAPKPSSPSPPETSIKSAPSQEPTQVPPNSQSSVSVPTPTPTTSQPVAPTPRPAAPTPIGAPSLHPSLPPRPVASPAPFNKPQTPNRHPAPPVSQAPPALSSKVIVPAPPKQDSQLIRVLEVSCIAMLLLCIRAERWWTVHSKKIGSHGLHSGVLARSIYTISEK